MTSLRNISVSYQTDKGRTSDPQKLQELGVAMILTGVREYGAGKLKGGLGWFSSKRAFREEKKAEKAYSAVLEVSST